MFGAQAYLSLVTCLTPALPEQTQGWLALGGVLPEQKMLKGHLPRVMCHQAYWHTKIERVHLSAEVSLCLSSYHSGREKTVRLLVLKKLYRETYLRFSPRDDDKLGPL